MLNERGSASKKEKNDESNSFDLDNSDQLNDIISKYENMLGDEKGESAKLNGRTSGQRHTPSNPQAEKHGEKEGNQLEESWGQLQMQAADLLGDDILKNSPDAKLKTENSTHSVHTSSA